jgi:hypothetical protein
MHDSDMQRRRLIGGGATVADGLGERAREVQHDEAKAVVHVAATVGAWSGEDMGSSELERPAMADGYTRARGASREWRGMERALWCFSTSAQGAGARPRGRERSSPWRMADTSTTRVDH